MNLLTLEPSDSDVPKGPSYYSFKHHAAGFNYEVGVDLFTSRCIWLWGPFPAGAYKDAKMFREGGLMARLKRLGKKAIGDEGYKGFPDTISTANSLDSKEVKEFKARARARARHETYNSKLKTFAILSERFRCKNNPNDEYSVQVKLQMAFEAVNILVQYKMEFGEQLYDV
jgi:DDE superfamily endonuclease